MWNIKSDLRNLNETRLNQIYPQFQNAKDVLDLSSEIDAFKDNISIEL